MSNGIRNAYDEPTPEERAMLNIVLSNEAMADTEKLEMIEDIAQTLNAAIFKKVISQLGFAKTDEEANAFVWFYYERWR